MGMIQFDSAALDEYRKAKNRLEQAQAAYQAAKDKLPAEIIGLLNGEVAGTDRGNAKVASQRTRTEDVIAAIRAAFASKGKAAKLTKNQIKEMTGFDEMRITNAIVKMGDEIERVRVDDSKGQSPRNTAYAIKQKKK